MGEGPKGETAKPGKETIPSEYRVAPRMLTQCSCASLSPHLSGGVKDYKAFLTFVLMLEFRKAPQVACSPRGRSCWSAVDMIAAPEGEVGWTG